jgi:membrane-associated phospholipid phosphatase
LPVTIKPTSTDLAIARAVARYTDRRAEEVANISTWGVDEHVLIGLALAWWVWCRTSPPGQRRASNHVLVTTLAASVLPHLLKKVFNQRRPDRLTIEGHLHGAPISGKPRDAFPSGHAIHVGALASAASRLPTAQRNTAWAVGAGFAATRVILLAHWASDVIAGLAIGVGLERLLRLLTGFGQAKKRPR